MQKLPWEEMLVMWLSEFRENNMTEYRKTSQEYNEKVRKEEELHKKVQQLKLTSEERQLIDELLSAQSATEEAYSSASYLFGITDCMRFISFFQSLYRTG